MDQTQDHEMHKIDYVKNTFSCLSITSQKSWASALKFLHVYWMFCAYSYKILDEYILYQTLLIMTDLILVHSPSPVGILKHHSYHHIQL